MNFIQLLSRIKQSLKAKTRRERIFIARSVTHCSIIHLPFYKGKLSENFGKISTNAQKIGIVCYGHVFQKTVHRHLLPLENTSLEQTRNIS